MVFAMNNFAGLLGVVTEGTVEQAQFELDAKYACHARIDHGGRNGTILNQADQFSIGITARRFQVNTGCEGLNGRFGLVMGSAVELIQHTDDAIVGKHVTFESPLFAKHICEQPFAGVDRNTIHFVVGHQAIDVSLFYGRLEGYEMEFTQNTV